MANDPIPEPDQEINIEIVKKRAVQGVLVLTGRGFILNAISFIAQGMLWAFLGQFELGVFAIVSATVSFLGYFSDIGLAAALVQKKENPSDKDLKTTFLVQQILVMLAVIALFVLAPTLASQNNLSNDGRILMYALAISFFLSSLKSIPSILLERELEFVKFSIPTIIETLFYNVVLVFLAWKGFGIRSFTYAVIIRSLVGVVTMYILKPWRPGFAFSLDSLKHLLKFGIPYQINSFIAVFKDQGIIILLGRTLGPTGVGILDTSQRMVNIPLRFVMDNVTKVAFPTFSRMQEEREHLIRAVTRAIFFVSFLTFPVIAGFVIASPVLFSVIPNYNKWLVAVPVITVLAINAFFATVSTPLFNMLYAIKKVKVTLYLMAMWAVLTWLLIPYLSTQMGVQGAALGYALVGSSSIIGIHIAHKYVPFSYWNSFGQPLLATLIMIAVLLVVRPFVPVTFAGLGMLVGAGAIAYGASTLTLVGAALVEDVKKSIKVIFSK